MPQDPEALRKLVVEASAFLLILAVWLEAMLIWWRRRAARRERFEERLQPGTEEAPSRLRALRLWHEERGSATGARGARRPRLLERLERCLQEAGWDVPAHVLLMGLAAVALLVFGVAFALTGSVPGAVLLAVAGPVLFNLLLQSRLSRRAALFERQLLDALGLMKGSLRAGHPLAGAFRFVSMEIGPPVGELFGEICQEQALGVRLEDAMRNAAERTLSPDMKMFGSAVAVQLRSGGNLADMMERLASVIRDRVRVNRRLRVATSQARLSKQVLLAMPFVFLVGFNIAKPDYMAPLYETSAGNTMLALAGAGLVLGAWVMNRMTVLRY